MRADVGLQGRLQTSLFISPQEHWVGGLLGGLPPPLGPQVAA